MASSDVRGSSRQMGVARRAARRGVPEQVGRAEGLLEADEADVVQLVELGVPFRERAVGVGLQGHGSADVGAQRLQMTGGAPGGDLHPQACRACPQGLVRLGEQVVHLVVEPEGGARGHGGGGRAQPPGQRALGGPELGVEHRQLQRGAGHGVAAHGVEVRAQRHRIAGRTRAGAGEEVVAEHDQSGLAELRRVGGLWLGDALGPALRLDGAHVHQQDVPVRAGARGAAQR